MRRLNASVAVGGVCVTACLDAINSSATGRTTITDLRMSAHFRSTDRIQLKLKYGHHQQPQQHRHYD
jgi:hypothetical protein